METKGGESKLTLDTGSYCIYIDKLLNPIHPTVPSWLESTHKLIELQYGGLNSRSLL